MNDVIRLQLKRSDEIVNGEAKKPKSTDLLDGEIAVNTVKGHETLFIKNTEGEVISLPLNLLKTILDNEEVISNAISKIANAVGIIQPDGEIAYKSDQYQNVVEATEGSFMDKISFLPVDSTGSYVDISLLKSNTFYKIPLYIRGAGWVTWTRKYSDNLTEDGYGNSDYVTGVMVCKTGDFQNGDTNLYYAFSVGRSFNFSDTYKTKILPIDDFIGDTWAIWS